LTGADPEARYVAALLKTKLALDRVYIRHASLRRDFAIIGRTLMTIAPLPPAKRKFRSPPVRACVAHQRDSGALHARNE